MPRPNEAAFLRSVLQNNEAAAQYCEALFRISQTLDDLIDKDHAVTDTAVIQAFWEALIELPANPFYRQHEPYLRPLMASALQDWRDSVCFERTDSHHLRSVAFVLRDQLATLLIQCAYLVGGYQWMSEVSVPVRQHIHEDTLGDYMASLNTPPENDSQEVSQ